MSSLSTVLRRIKGDEKLKVVPVVIKPVEFSQFVDAVKGLGVFCAIINQPPIGSVSRGL